MRAQKSTRPCRSWSRWPTGWRRTTGCKTTSAGALAGYLAGRRKEAKAEDKNVKIAVKALLRGQVMDLGLHYISKGYIPPYGLETLRNYYDPYVALGDGDPSIKHIVETCESLPVHSGEMEVNT